VLPWKQHKLNFAHNVRIGNVKVVFYMCGRKYCSKLHNSPMSEEEIKQRKTCIHSFAHIPGLLLRHCDPIAYQNAPLHHSVPTPRSLARVRKDQERVGSAYVTVHDASAAYAGVGSVEMVTCTPGHVSGMPEPEVGVPEMMSNVDNHSETQASKEALGCMRDG